MKVIKAKFQKITTEKLKKGDMYVLPTYEGRPFGVLYKIESPILEWESKILFFVRESKRGMNYYIKDKQEIEWNNWTSRVQFDNNSKVQLVTFEEQEKCDGVKYIIEQINGESNV